MEKKTIMEEMEEIQKMTDDMKKRIDENMKPSYLPPFDNSAQEDIEAEKLRMANEQDK